LALAGGEKRRWGNDGEEQEWGHQEILAKKRREGIRFPPAEERRGSTGGEGGDGHQPTFLGVGTGADGGIGDGRREG
jgi:hypothetical protein